jgi:hypothetical protein
VLLRWQGLLAMTFHVPLRLAALACAWLLPAFAACGDYVPDESSFRRELGLFIVESPKTVVPIYANADVNSQFGKYVVEKRDVKSVLSEVERRALIAGWSIDRRSTSELELHKVTLGIGLRYEIVRVVCTSNPATCYVGWVEIDGAKTLDEVAASPEGGWANRRFWPRFEAASRH